MDDPRTLDAIGRQVSLVAAFVEKAAHAVAQSSARLGERVTLDAGVLDRGDSITLVAPGHWSANRCCQMIKARDGWLAANLPREDDLRSVPALVMAAPGDDPWRMLIDKARVTSRAELVSRGEVLGLALASVGETPAPPRPCAVHHLGAPRGARGGLRVTDFSSLWAGPLCGSVFAAMGADVVKIEGVERPDTTAKAAPLLDQRLNAGKRRQRLYLNTTNGRAELLEKMAASDVLITSARARALTALGLTREVVFTANPGLVWVAVTGHGWASNRIAFGDDAAAAGGLVAWNGDAPSFVGDAIADPLTGLAAAACALDLIARGGGAFVDAALAQIAAYVAAGRGR